LKPTLKRFGFALRRSNSDESVILEIEEEGKGCSPTELAEFMKPFFTTKRDQGGTGLGLAIAESIIFHHRATCEAISKNSLMNGDHGLLFRIEFPTVGDATEPF